MAKANAEAKKKKETKVCEKKCFCKSDLFKRIATSVVLIPLVLFVLILGYPFLNLFVLFLGALFAYEWSKMVENNNPAFYATAYTVVFSLGIMFPLSLIFAVFLLLSALFVWFKAKGEKYRKLLVLGVFYVSVGMGSILWFAQEVGFFSTIWLLLMIWATDIGAFLVGPALKGPKIAPKISPNKRWSGALGGIIFAACVSASYVWGAGNLDTYAPYVIFAVIVSIFGQIGDFVESAIKRCVGVKDSSQMIPGHGGLFDRMDSLLFVTPILVIVIICVKLFFKG
ncbi:MAG: phosphatidate cytidylyltransferase [Alphaproteobacteria bacterium]